jgi:capsular polysaccharide biosynthesis protein
LASYFEIKKSVPSLKCLIQTSHPTKPTLSLFVKEFLTLLNIDYVLADPNVLYTTMFVSTSFTHGGKSNEPPSPMAYDIWKQCRYPNQEDFQKEAPKLFYVSRRSWVHGDTSNIGTNYTQRRKCINEDNLVVLLEKYGFQEVFTEQLATFGKLLYFDEAEAVVGIVGGGLCNLLFSTKQTKALCITTPYFMEINERFKYSMENANLYYTDCTYHANPEYKFKLYSRVRIIQPTSPYYNLIGEVEKVEGTMCTIHLSSNDVAGFSQDFPFLETIVQENELEAVDQGLNSPFYVDLEKFEADLKLMLSID